MPAPKLGATYLVKLLEAGWSPRTDRFYPISCFRKLVEQFKPSIGDFLFSGDVMSPRMNRENISHRTNRLFLGGKDTQLWSEVQLLDTSAGRLVADLYPKGNIRFDCLIAGTVNYCNEVQDSTIHYLRVVAYGTYKVK